MRIGIDASRAFSEERTGIEEYSFQVVNHLKECLKNDQACLPMRQVILYVRRGQKTDFNLPSNWIIKKIKWPLLWTQVGLSLEMLFHPVDVLFVPSHVVPAIHPSKTVTTVHGLEYEFFPHGYSFWERVYMRTVIKASCQWASKIIAVSQNTRKDLIKLYQVPEEKIEVVYEGIPPFVKGGMQGDFCIKSGHENPSPTLPFSKGENYLLFIGRLEARKNIIGIIKAFEILKEKYKIPHQLVLSGKPGYDYENIKSQIAHSRYREDIVETGYISEERKMVLLKGATVFLFPSFYEGFGLPILEAQASGVPVVTSNISSMPEITTLPPPPQMRGGMGRGDESALLIDPKDPEEIAGAAYRLIADKNLKDAIINKGHQNIGRFSWSECAHQIAKIIVE